MSFSFQVIAAPMAGISNRSYRDIVRSMGADLAYGEMVSAQAITYGNKKTLELMDIGDEASPRLVQLFGSSPEHIQEAAAVAKDLGADYIDINMGCPVPKVVRNGEGSALMREPALAEALVTAAASVGLPVSVKIRAGWDAAHRNAVEICPKDGIRWCCFYCCSWPHQGTVLYWSGGLADYCRCKKGCADPSDWQWRYF